MTLGDVTIRGLCLVCAAGGAIFVLTIALIISGIRTIFGKP